MAQGKHAALAGLWPVVSVTVTRRVCRPPLRRPVNLLQRGDAPALSETPRRPSRKVGRTGGLQAWLPHLQWRRQRGRPQPEAQLLLSANCKEHLHSSLLLQTQEMLALPSPMCRQRMLHTHVLMGPPMLLRQAPALSSLR